LKGGRTLCSFVPKRKREPVSEYWENGCPIDEIGTE
jgi:hypothetical protein